MMLRRVWPSPTRPSSETHVRCPSGPRWASRPVACSSAAAETAPRAAYIATSPHMPSLLRLTRPSHIPLRAYHEPGTLPRAGRGGVAKSCGAAALGSERIRLDSLAGRRLLVDNRRVEVHVPGARL